MYTEPGIEATACARELLYVYVYVYVCCVTPLNKAWTQALFCVVTERREEGVICDGAEEATEPRQEAIAECRATVRHQPVTTRGHDATTTGLGWTAFQ